MELSLLSYYLPPRAEKRQKIQARWRSVIYTMSGRSGFSDTHTIRSAAYTVTAERPPRWRRHPPQSLPPAGLKEPTSGQARASSFGLLTEVWTLRPLLAPGDPRRRSPFPPQSPASGEACSQSTALSHRRRHGDASPSTAHARAQGRGFLGKMAASGLRQAGAAASTAVKPIFSRDLNEAKRRVRELYRAWYREVPNTGERPGCVRGPEAPAQGLTPS